MDSQEKKCIQSLPNELLLKILGYLPCNFRLASVNRVCRQFKDLIDSMAMTSLDLKVTFSEKEILKMEKSIARRRHAVHGLLQKLLQQPSWLPPSYKRFRRLFKHLEQHPKLLKEIRSVSLTVQDRSWYISCFQHNRLLHSLPYLEYLTLSPPPAFSTLSSMQSLNYGPRAVRSLRLDFLPLTALWYHDNVSEDFLDVINHYLHWSALHKLRIDGLVSIERALADDATTVISDLWCVRCRNHGTATMHTRLMRSSTGLVRYVFETSVHYDRAGGIAFPPPLSPFSLYDDGLRMHKRTLRQLVIASSDDCGIDPHWLLRPLDTFCQLEKLALPFFMLPEPSLGKADYETLPPRLEELQIEYPFHGIEHPYSGRAWIFTNQNKIVMFGRRTWTRIYSDFDTWPSIFDKENRLGKFRSRTRQMKSRLPYLKRLIIWFQGDHALMAKQESGIFDPFTLKTLRVLKQAFKDFDIKLEWLVAFSFWDTPVGKALDAEGDVIMEESGDAEGDSITLHSTSTTV